MSVKAAFVVPHPPLIVPEVGCGREQEIASTVRAYEKVVDEIASLKPDTVIISSPHTVMYADYFHISPGKKSQGDCSGFGAPEVQISAEYDEEFVQELCRLSGQRDLPSGTLGEKEKKLDHGVLIPLYFIGRRWKNYRLVRLGLSGLSLEEHYSLGSMAAEVSKKLGRRSVFVASGDLSHRLKADGPYGFSPEGPVYDEKVMEIMGNADFDKLFNFTDDFLGRAAECGHRSFVMMAGALDGLSVDAQKLSHEGPFGVGYGVCTFIVTGENENRRFGQRRLEYLHGKAMKKKQLEDEYAALARRSLEYYVRNKKKLERPGELSEELTSRQAGAFVSLKKGGRLRGCIGTISPVQSCLAEEIMENAVSAGMSDPRFPPVKLEELDLLEYGVDVLEAPEPVSSADQLDVKRYGVIVTNGGRRGLLLPDLEGVDTVNDQLSIAKQKAGIGEDEPVKIERFRVVRHQ